MRRNHLVVLLCFGIFSLALAPVGSASIVVFSNDFEDGDTTPEIGSYTHTQGTTETTVATSHTDPVLGNTVGFFDQGGLDFTYDVASPAPLTNGATVTLDFDFAARRTSGNTKTIFVDALDSSGAIVVRLVLGDTDAFGNSTADRQRPGHDPTSAGLANTQNTAFGNPPGSFWWGADTTPTSFITANASGVADVAQNREAHMSLTIGASSFDFSTTRAFGGQPFSTIGVTNRDGGTYADVASLQFTSAGDNYGFYLDNVVVVSVPEPGSLAVLGLAALGLCGFRRRR